MEVFFSLEAHRLGERTWNEFIQHIYG